MTDTVIVAMKIASCADSQASMHNHRPSEKYIADRCRMKELETKPNIQRICGTNIMVSPARPEKPEITVIIKHASMQHIVAGGKPRRSAPGAFRRPERLARWGWRPWRQCPTGLPPPQLARPRSPAPTPPLPCCLSPCLTPRCCCQRLCPDPCRMHSTYAVTALFLLGYMRGGQPS